MVSAYIFALCCLQFPMRPFKTFNQEVNGKFDKTEIERFERLGRCWFAKVRLLNVKIKKDRFMEYIPEGKCTQKLNAISNCGRIISADFLELWITDIDWNIINNTYDFDDYFEFDDVNYSKYGKLPEELTTLLKNLFSDKTILKGCSDKSLYDHAKKEDWTKEQFLTQVAKIPGVYVPSFYEHIYKNQIAILNGIKDTYELNDTYNQILSQIIEQSCHHKEVCLCQDPVLYCQTPFH